MAVSDFMILAARGDHEKRIVDDRFIHLQPGFSLTGCYQMNGSSTISLHGHRKEWIAASHRNRRSSAPRFLCVTGGYPQAVGLDSFPWDALIDDSLIASFGKLL
jgi:hypothetical protein